jgi:hypothetical protein
VGEKSTKNAATSTPKTAESNFFLISFHISIYKFIASENPIIFASNAQVRPTKGNVFLVRHSLGEGGFRIAMKKSKSFFSQLHKKAILYGLADEGKAL